jgi:hypothetical protein
MSISPDRRSVGEQAKSGVKIAAAILATFAALAFIAIAYLQITEVKGRHHVLVGWLLIAALVVILSATVQFWCKWFYFLPGLVVIRSGLWFLLGWFTPRGYIPIGFLILTTIMTILSFRFSKLTRILVTDRIVLLSAFACLFSSVTAALSQEPKISALVLAGLGDVILFLQWAVVRKPGVRMRQREKVETGTVVSTSGH